MADACSRLRGKGYPGTCSTGHACPAYGLALAGGYVGTPEVGVALSDTGREVRTAWRVDLAGRPGLAVALSVEAARRSSDTSERDIEDRFGAGLSVRR